MHCIQLCIGTYPAIRHLGIPSDRIRHPSRPRRRPSDQKRCPSRLWSRPSDETERSSPREGALITRYGALPAHRVALLIRYGALPTHKGAILTRYGAIPTHDRFRSPIPALEGALLKKGVTRKFWLVGTDSWAPKPTYPQNLLSSRISATLFLKCCKCKIFIHIKKKNLLKYPYFCRGRPPLISRLGDASVHPPAFGTNASEIPTQSKDCLMIIIPILPNCNIHLLQK